MFILSWIVMVLVVDIWAQNSSSTSITKMYFDALNHENVLSCDRCSALYCERFLYCFMTSKILLAQVASLRKWLDFCGCCIDSVKDYLLLLEVMVDRALGSRALSDYHSRLRLSGVI